MAFSLSIGVSVPVDISVQWCSYLKTTVLFGVATMKLVKSRKNAPTRNGTRFLQFLSHIPGVAELSVNETFNVLATQAHLEYV